MTAQIPDRLIHRGLDLDLYATPLYDWMNRRPKARRPRFLAGSTANWRGYVATWEIIGQKLFLTAIDDAVIDVGSRVEEATLATIFPRGPFPVAATWFTGELVCPEGRLRNYVHASFASEYERTRKFYVEKGAVIDEWLIYNPPAPLCYLIGPDGGRTYATAQHPEALAPDADPFPNGAPVEPWRVWGDRDWDIWRADEGEGYVIVASTRLR